jgi:hypothetical protein
VWVATIQGWAASTGGTKSTLIYVCMYIYVYIYNDIYIYSILLLVNRIRKSVNKKRNMKVYRVEGLVPEAPAAPFQSFIMLSCSI